jgi:biotin carboxylase
MPCVLLLATTTGYQTRSFSDAAEALGVELVFATDRCEQIDDPWRDGAIAIRFHEEAQSVDAIVAAARIQPLDGLLVVGDRPTMIGALAAQALGIPWHSPAAVAVARHKRLIRERLGGAGLPTPWFLTTSVSADARLLQPPAFPCVVKPVSLSGSRGVIRADDPESFHAAFDRVRALLRSPDVQVERSPAHDTILIEGFIPGREYALEGLMHRGDLRVLAIFDKPDPLDGPFFEETIYLTPSLGSDAEQQAITDAIRRAAAAIGLHHGPIHAECRVNDAGVFVLEVAARPIGGICARSLRFEREGSRQSEVSLEE